MDEVGDSSAVHQNVRNTADRYAGVLLSFGDGAAYNLN